MQDRLCHEPIARSRRASGRLPLLPYGIAVEPSSESEAWLQVSTYATDSQPITLAIARYVVDSRTSRGSCNSRRLETPLVKRLVDDRGDLVLRQRDQFSRVRNRVAGFENG